MAATSLFFNGRLIFKPGSYSIIDASGLEQVGLGASGIVAVIGSAVGGRPVDDIEETKDFIRFTSPSKVGEVFRSGDLLEAGSMLFGPSSDAEIQAGAQEMVAMKVNPATQSTVTLSNTNGASIIITSADYGDFTNQINISIANGTVKGKLVTIALEDEVESADNVGGDVMFTLLYRSPTGTLGEGWGTMTADVTSSGVITAGTKAKAGNFTHVTLGIASILTIASTNAADTTQTLTIFGLVGGVPTQETVSLNGTTNVLTTNTFDANGVFACSLSAVAAGTVTVKDSAVTTLLSVSAGAISRGGTKCTAMFAQGTLSVVADAATTDKVWLVGRNSSNSKVINRLTLNGTTPVNSTTTNWGQVDFLVLGELADARTVTVSGSGGNSVHTSQDTLLKLQEFFNGKQVANLVTPADAYGFTMEIESPLVSLDPADLDETTPAVNVYSPTTGSFYADLFLLVDYLNNNVSLVTAAEAPSAQGVPDNTPQPVYLSGGSEGTTTFADWQKALNLLKKVRVNSIVALSGDPAVHAAVKAHCEYMCGIGRSERDGFVGLMNAAQDDVPSKSEAKSQIVALNSRHIRAFAQEIERFDTQGERTAFLPPFQAVIAAGMQAGSPVGTSLTFKVGNALSIRSDSSWNPVDDAEEMIQSGLCFMEEVEGIGRRWVRNVTTHLSSSNIAFTEGSVNEATNFATFNFRTNMEVSVGRKGFSGTINAAKSVALATLGALVDQQILVAFRSLDIQLVVDVLEVAVEIAPVIPINFVRNTLHLVSIRQAA